MNMLNLDHLNKQQRQAVEHTSGPLLLLAGAGTGKTNVLTHRIAYIVRNGLCVLDQILAVTFTNKAASEMQDRVSRLLGVPGISMRNSWIGTFHSVCLKILRSAPDLIGRTTNFSLVDESDQKSIVKRICKERGISLGNLKSSSIVNIINRWKDQLRSYEDIRSISYTNDAYIIASQVYKYYTDILNESDRIDFGDVLLLCVKLFEFRKDILAFWQHRFCYIMVDEYQDTNYAQERFIELMSAKHRNICCVGDDDQLIYSWRGSDIDNILGFQDRYVGAQIIRLEQNYRSTGNILAVANGIIAHNKNRLGKELWTESGDGRKVCLRCFLNPTEEAHFISSHIGSRVGSKYSDYAILVRSSFQTLCLERVMIERMMPYRIFGNIKFFDRKEIKDALAYFRLITNCNDQIAFERVINTPSRKIGSVTLNKLYGMAVGREDSFWSIARNTLYKKACNFFDAIEEVSCNNSFENIGDMMKLLLTKVGYIEMLQKSQDMSDQERLTNIQELINFMSEFGMDTHSFIDYISLAGDMNKVDMDNCVTICTIHASKGLEFDNVFVVGLVEGNLPSIQIASEQEIEEERRILYVAITRAKEELHLSCYTYSGSGNYSMPSRFLLNLDMDACVSL